jgi:hypothetical protein
MRSMPRAFNYVDGHKSHRDSWQVFLSFAGCVSCAGGVAAATQ